MNRFAPFAQLFLGNDLRAWLIASGIFVAAFTALLVFKRILVARFVQLAARTETKVDDVLADVLARTKYFFIITLSAFAASLHLTLSPTAQVVLRNVVVIAMMLQIGIWFNALIGFWVRAYAERRGETGGGATTLAVLGIVARCVVWAIFILVALDTLGIDITALVAGLGIGGVAVALAVQNILGDLFAALSIIVDRPFEVGDVIAVDTFTGTVEKIGMKSTRLRAVTGEQVIFSNADLLRSRVRNLKRMTERRIIFTVGVQNDTAPEIVEGIPRLLQAAVEKQPLVRFERAHFFRFGESSLDFEVAYTVSTPDYVAYMDAHQAICLDIMRLFSGAKMGFAYPTRTVVVKGAAPGDSAAAAAAGSAGSDAPAIKA